MFNSRPLRKAISFFTAAALFLSVVVVAIPAASANSISEFSVKTLAENIYDDAVALGNSFLLFEGGTADDIDSNTTVTYLDKNGNMSAFANTLGFTKIQRPVSGNAYYRGVEGDFNLIARLIKGDKEILVGPDGKVFGSVFYDEAYYVNQNVFIALDGNDVKIISAVDGSIIKNIVGLGKVKYSCVDTAFIINNEYLFNANGQPIMLPFGTKNINFNGNGYISYIADGKFGMLDLSGNIVVPAVYTDIDTARFGTVAKVQIGSYDAPTYNFIDKNGNKLLAEDFEGSVAGYDDTGALLRDTNKKIGFYTFSRVSLTIPFGTYDSEQTGVSTKYYYGEGKLIVRKTTYKENEITNLTNEIINTYNNSVVLAKTDKYDLIKSYVNGAAVVSTSVTNDDGDKDYLYGFLNADGKEICEPQYDSIYDNNNFANYTYNGKSYKYAIVSKNYKYGILDYEGNEIVPTKYNSLPSVPTSSRYKNNIASDNLLGYNYRLSNEKRIGFIDGIAIVNDDEYNVGVIDIEGNEVIAPGTFDFITPASNRLLNVLLPNGNWAVADYNGDIISDEYEQIGIEYELQMLRAPNYDSNYDRYSYNNTYGILQTEDGFMAVTKQNGKLGVIRAFGGSERTTASKLNDESTDISIAFDNGVLPNDTVLDVQTVTQSNQSAVFTIISDALEQTSNKFAAFDISVISAGEEVQPNGKVTVKIPVPAGFNKNKTALFRIAPDGTRSAPIEFTLDSRKQYIIFETELFGLYAIAEQFAYFVGDTSGDGDINIFDIMSVRNYIFGYEDYDSLLYYAANIDKDDIINLFDIFAIRNHIFGSALIADYSEDTTFKSYGPDIFSTGTRAPAKMSKSTSMQSTGASTPSISVNGNVQIVENTNGTITTMWRGEMQTDEEYYYYYVDLYELTNYYGVTIDIVDSDGTAFTIDADNCWDYYVEVQHTQHEEPWGIGTHTITINYDGCSALLDVEIIESPVESIDLQGEIKIIENTNGYINSHYNYQTDDYEDYYHYDVYLDDIVDGNRTIVITNKDGTVETIDSDNYWGYNNEFDINNNQYDEPWGIGTHEIQLSYKGVTITIDIEIIESPIESIALQGEIKIIENTNGYIGSRYNYQTDEYEDYYRYSVYLENIVDDNRTIVITNKDGTVETIDSDNYWDYYNDFDTENNQYDEPWGIGTHEITINYKGRFATLYVEIIESPVVSIDVQATKELLEESNGYWGENYNSETDEYEPGFVYYSDYFENFGLIVTVNYNDGSQIIIDNDNNYYEYSISTADDSYLKKGDNSLVISVDGFSKEFTVRIIENPVESITVSTDINIAEHTNGNFVNSGSSVYYRYFDEYYYDDTGFTKEFCQYFKPTITVYYKDGHTEVIDDWDTDFNTTFNELLENGLSVESYQYSDNLWVLGNNEVSLTYMNRQATFEVAVVANGFPELLENVQTLTASAGQTTSISNNFTYSLFSFVPTQTKAYTLSSSGNSDTVVYLLDQNGAQLAADDDSGNGYNFTTTSILKAGTTYYYAVGFYSHRQTGSITVNLS